MVKLKRNTSFEYFAPIRRFTECDFLQDSSWIIYISDISGQLNLWKQDLSNRRRKKPQQLTDFIDISVRAFFPSPVDKTLIFFADRNGNENFQIYSLNSVTGQQERITSNDEFRYEMGKECLSRDGQYIIYSSNEKNRSSMLIYTRSVRKKEEIPTCLTPVDGWFIPGYWSPDSKKISYGQYLTPTRFDLWLAEIETKAITRISPSKNECRFIAGPWSPRDEGFYLLTDLNHEYFGLAFYDLAKMKMEWILKPNRDIENVEISRKGNLFAWTTNQEGYSKLHIKNIETNEIQKLEIPDGVISKLKISPDERVIACLLTTPAYPHEVYVIRLETCSVQKLTNAFSNSSIKKFMTTPRLIKFRSFDGLEIPSILYKPIKALTNRKKAKIGVVLSIHGGPSAQERPTYAYEGLYQFLSNRGIGILAPNFRGSTGYGKSFEKEIFHNWGGKELTDLEYAVKWLLSQDWVDQNKIAVFGGSFGGFAALSCITRLNQFNWCAAIDIMGPCNLVTFAKTVPPHWQLFMNEFVGDPDKEVKFLHERSPCTYIGNIKKTSILIIQGSNDPRVKKFQSDELVNELRNNGIYVKYIVFEDEGHGFTKHSNMLKAYKSTGNFLVKMLLELPDSNKLV